MGLCCALAPFLLPVLSQYAVCLSINFIYLLARVPQLLKLMLRASALQQEKPPQQETHTPQRRVAPARHN